MAHKVIIAGGAGFIGSAVARRLRERGHEVVVLTRSRPRRRGDGIREVQWDGRTAGAWAGELEGALAMVNLAGRSIDCVHTEENRRVILQSRLDSVAAVSAALAACSRPPAVWVQASAIGIYGDVAADRRCEETTAVGSGYLPEVCRQWEAAFAAACPAGGRGVVLRIGVVLGRKGGALPALVKATRWLVGGTAGSGRQGISWIHLTDLEEIFLRAIGDETMRGVYNACAPEPAGNAGFMATLRHVLHRPWAPPAPAFMLRPVMKWIMRTEPSLVLEGQYGVPARLLAEGFRFRYGRLVSALTDLVERP